MARAHFTMGLVFRRGFRRILIRSGLKFSEDKGWLDSQFTVEGPPATMARLVAAVRQLEAETA